MNRVVGTVFQAVSGQWSWAILEDGKEIAGGGGYSSKDDAFDDMYLELGFFSLTNQMDADPGHGG